MIFDDSAFNILRVQFILTDKFIDDSMLAEFIFGTN